MAVNKIKVNTDTLSSDANTVAEAIGVLEQQLSGLEDDYNQLDSMWDGPTSEIFRVAYHDDIDALKTIAGNLKKFNSFEVNAKDKYNACEGEVSGVVDSLNW